MSVKHRYSLTRPPVGIRRGPPKEPLGRRPPRRQATGERERCTCWVLVRGDEAQPLNRETADCELVPDPDCPVHGKKRYPILEDGFWDE